MALYDYKCNNVNCEKYETIKTVSIPMTEYNDKKLPLCDKCNCKTIRSYNAVSHQTFSDGFKGK